MTRNSSTNGNGARLSVANLTDGNDIRVLTQDGAQSCRKRHAGLFVDLALVNARNVVFHRVLQRHEVRFLICKFLQHGAHRRGFTGTGRAHNQNHAAAVFEQRIILLQVCALKADGLLRDRMPGFIEQTQNNLFAVDRRHGRDTQVDLVVTHLHHGTAVLRDLTLGNIHATHDFQAGNNVALQIRGHGQNLSQNAVDTHAHHHFALLRLKVDVARALQKGALNDGVYKADRRRGRRVAGIRLVHLHRHDIRCGCADFSLHFFNGAGRAFAAVQCADGLLGRAARGDHRHNALMRSGLNLFLRNEVQRIAHGNKELVFYKLYRHHVVFFRDSTRHKFGELQRNGDRR